MQRKTLDEDFLREVYCDKNLMLTEIKQITGISEKTIRKIIKQYDLVRNFQNPEWLYEKHYIERLNCRQIAKLANCTHETIHRWMKKLDIKVDLSISSSTYNQNNNYFEVIDTEEKAYWLGFIMADGCIEKERNRLTISLQQSDCKHLEKFLSIIKSDRTIDNYNSTILKETGKRYDMCRIIITSRDFVSHLVNLGFDNRKSLNEFIPKIHSNLFRHFVRGYFDGDGCFYYNLDGRKRIRVDLVGGEDFLNKVQDKITDYESFIMHVRQKSGNLFQLYLADKHAVHFMNWIYLNSTIHLDRKFEKYSTFCGVNKSAVAVG